MAAKKTTRPAKAGAAKLPASPIATAPEAVRCQHEDTDGRHCPKAIYRPGAPFCLGHMQEAGDLATMKENNLVGDAKTADEMRAELEGLRAQNAVLQAQSARLQAEPIPAPAAEDAALTASRLAIEMQGAAPTVAPPAAPKAARVVPGEESAHAAAVAMLVAAQEQAYAERDSRRRDRKRRGLPVDEGRPSIELRVEIPAQLDPSAMVDEYGNNLIPPGYVSRWLRTYDVDPNGARHPSDYRIRLHRQTWGAVPVMEPVYDEQGKKTGQTRHKKGVCGEAYMIPMEAYAKRILHHSPHGAFDQVLDGEAGRLDDVIESENRRYGKRGGVGQLVVTEEHGSRSAPESL